MRCNHHFATCFNRGHNHIFPVRYNTLYCVFEALGQRQLLARHMGVTRVVGRVHLAARIQWIGGSRIRTSPHQDLLIAVLGGGFGFVQALQCAIVTLIQMPIGLHWNIRLIHFIEHAPERVNRAFEHRCECQVKFKARFFE